jgi:uncharacterized protein (DUF983 family)
MSWPRPNTLASRHTTSASAAAAPAAAKLRPSCEVCGLDYSYADPADGPAFFAITFACLPSAMFAVWLELAYQAPYWVHVFTTFPIMLVTLLPPLRPLKGWLVASQYYHKAEEGRLVRPGEAEETTGW